MFRIDHPSRAAALPSPEAVATQGFFTRGNPSTSTPATVVTDDWLNAVQEELMATVEAADLVADKGSRAQLATAVARLIAAGASGNVLINPEFRFWQRRGPNLASNPMTDVSGYHGPDRWRFDAGQAGESGSLGRVRLASVGALLGAGAEYALQWKKDVAAGPGAEVHAAQRVERVSTFAGQKVVVAFDAIKNSGADLTILGVDLIQNFGTGGSPSTSVTTTLTAQAGTTIDGTGRRLVFVGALPSIAGKTLGTTSDYLELRIRVAQAVAFDVYVTAFVMARGAQDPGFIARHDSEELQRCRRYYQKSGPVDSAVTSGFNQEVVPWDFNWANATVDILSRVRLTTPLFRFGLVTATTFYANSTAGQVEEVTGAGGVYHAAAVSPSVGTLEDMLGAPRLTTPPAGGTTRSFRFGWSTESEF